MLGNQDYKKLSVLCVNMDESCQSFQSYLEESFGDIYFTAPENALRVVRNHPIDLLIVNDKLELIETVRRRTWDLPIILLAKAEENTLFKAISLGVTQFVAKPANIERLQEAIELSIKRVVMENIKRRKHYNELSLLKYYNKAAFHKELHIMRNEYDNRLIEIKNDENELFRWTIDVFYEGSDIMSGDAFSVRKLSEEKTFCFLLDAMDTGLGASVTSMVAATFINYLVEKSGENIDFEWAITEFTHYIKKILLKDEILCACFLLIDFRKETMKHAAFSMPKLWVKRNDRTVFNIRSNNMPITRYFATEMLTTDEYSIANVAKILATSDGLSEAHNKEHSYEEYIQDDFVNSSTLADFKDRFLSRFPTAEDDITVLMVSRNDYNMRWEESCTVKSKLDNLHLLEAFFEKMVEKAGIARDDTIGLSISFNEAVMNAFEHGNLEVGLMEKHRALNEGKYDELIKAREAQFSDREIKVHIALVNHALPFIRIRVADEGMGVPVNIEPVKERDPMLLCGRGIEIIRQYMDQFYYSPDGTELVMMKTLSK